MQRLTLHRARLIFDRRSLCALCLLLILGGCGTLWQTAAPNVHTPHWSIDIPEKWMLLETSDYHMFSKDGPYLHYILVQSRPLERKYRHTNLKIDRAMLPHEAAQVVINDLRADPALRRLRIIDNAPVMIDGSLGFKIDYVYEDPNGMDQQTHFYGVVTPPFLFTLRYTAAKRHYFERYIDDFTRVLQSVRLQKNG
ncbi:MAG: hypothetical protein HKM93_23380 [Desulfobacteraceae bacterium]|nr:hypothetical protein [Desulfobacteraceae bacterium]